MRTSKKLLSMVLTILMVVGVFSAVASSYAFDDVEAYQTQIALMNELKIVEGYDETTFGYGEDVQRWQMALWIAKIMTGKVENAYVNWYDTTNYTTFTDINPDQFYGSISYGVENGIIKGYSETEYGPADQIIFQDAFTMVVRMLGYGSSAMDATYPWSYVDKAIKLGLDDGLRADYNNEEPATREEIVAILYNALFAPRADGTTYGAAKFNLTMDTVVITGTSRGNMFTDAANPSKVAADGSNYVTFNLLKDDGTIQASPSYYLPRTAFAGLGADDLAATLKIGYSYDVVTKDDYTTLLYAKENDTVVIDQDSIKGGDSDHTKDVVIGSDAYKAVVSYSTLGNGQGTKTTNDFEVILYTLGDNAAIGSGSYLRDINLNIVDKDGKIILTYIPHFLTGATTAYPTGTYMVETAAGSGVYRDPVEADWIKAAEAAVWNVPGITLYQAITNTNTQITNVNAYSDTILIDDDGNSDYDRGIYIYYSFGKIGVDGDGYLTSDAIPGQTDSKGNRVAGKIDSADKAAAYKYVDIDKYFAGEEYEIKQADVVGQYALYAVNTKTNVFYLKKTYETKIGYVTTVNKPAKTITFDQVYFGYNAGNITGTTYSVGVSNLPGGNYNSVLINYTDFDTLKGRTVNYVLDEKYSAILRIVDYGNDAGYVVIKDSVASLNTNGYANVLAYVNSNVASVITVASVDGYTNVTGAAMVNWYLKSGDLFKATKDALGMYHLTYIDPTNFTYYASTRNLARLGLNFNSGVAYTDAQADQIITLVDGKPTASSPDTYYDNNKGVAVAFDNFDTNKNTVIILANGTGDSQLVDNGYLPVINFETSKGVPANGSHITLNNAFDYNPDYSKIGGARIFVASHVSDGVTIADFVYVVDGTWGKNIAINPSGSQSYLDSNDTIIFVDKNTMETMIATNQTSTGLGVSIGTVYQYTNAIDFIRGGLTSAYTTALYNQRLFAGHFYYVKDGYVVGEVEVGATNQIDPTNTAGVFDIEIVKVSYVDKFVTIYQEWDGLQRANSNGNRLWRTSLGKPIVYELKDVTVTYKDGAPKNIVDDFAKIVNEKDSYATAYVYTGYLTGSIDNPHKYSGQKKLFITTTYTDAATLKVEHDLGATPIFTIFDEMPANTDDTYRYSYLFTDNGTLAYEFKDGKIDKEIAAGGTYVMFKLTKAQYDALSAYQSIYNNNWNDQDAGIGTTMKLYSNGNVVSDFINDRYSGKQYIDVDTQVVSRIGDYYYLYIKLVPGVYKTITATDPAYLVFTNPNNTNESYKIELEGGFKITRPEPPAPAEVKLPVWVKIEVHDVDKVTPLKDYTYKIFQGGKDITFNGYDVDTDKYFTQVDLNGGDITIQVRDNTFDADFWYFYSVTEWFEETQHDVVSAGKTPFTEVVTSSADAHHELVTTISLAGVSKEADLITIDFSKTNPYPNGKNIAISIVGGTFDYECSNPVDAIKVTGVKSVIDLLDDYLDDTYPAIVTINNTTPDTIYYYMDEDGEWILSNATDVLDTAVAGVFDEVGNCKITIKVVEPFKVVATYEDVQTSLTNGTITQGTTTGPIKTTKVNPIGDVIKVELTGYTEYFKAGKSYNYEVGDNFMKTDIAYLTGTVKCTVNGEITVTFDPKAATSTIDLASVVLNFTPVA